MCDDPTHNELLRRVATLTPQAVYLDAGDQLLWYLRNTQTAALFSLSGLIARPDGQIVPFNYTQTPTAARALNTLAITLGPGLLLSLCVSPNGALIDMWGAAWSQVQVWRTDSSGALLTNLVSGTLTADTPLVWPNTGHNEQGYGRGNLRVITGTNPAAGVEILQEVPLYVRWRLMALRATLVTAAAAATRRVHLVLDDGTDTFLDLGAADTQIISLTRNYNFAVDGFARAAADAEIYVPLPAGLFLRSGWRLSTVTTALNAGDNWSAPLLTVEEWLED